MRRKTTAVAMVALCWVDFIHILAKHSAVTGAQYSSYVHIIMYFGLVVRMSILDTEVDGSNPSISMFFP